MQTPKSVEIDITDRCNLRCRYCSHFDSAGEVGKDLATEEWLKFFDELGKCAVLDATLCGGEPFIREDLKELLNGIIKNRMRFSILSNGTLITDEMAAFLAATKRCNSAQVSIDGSNPASHDFCRGGGNFEKAISGLRRLKENGINTAVRVTIHKGNVNDLEAIAKLLLEDIGLSGFSTNSASHMGLCKQNAEMVQLSVEDRVKAMETLLKLNQKYDGHISGAAGPLAEAKMWTEMEKARQEGKENLPGRGFLASCGGVFSKIAVRADGAITPCLQLNHLKLGRINRDSLKEIWQNHPELKRMRERRSIYLGEFNFCKDCEYINYCAGGCPALSYTMAGEVYGPSPDACLRKFLNEGGRLPKVKKKVEVVDSTKYN